MNRRIRPVLTLASCALVVGVLTLITPGCGGGTVATSPSSSSTAAGASLPASLVQAGVLKVGTNMPYPPFEFYATDGKTPTGVEVDLVEAVAKNLDLRVQWINMNWDGLVPALVSKRFDMVAACLADYTDRQKIVTMIDFCKNGSAAVVLSQNASQLTQSDDLAGKTVGVLKGSIAAAQLRKLSAQFVSEGKQAIDLKMFPDDNAGLAAVKSGRVFAHVCDVPTAGYIIKTTGEASGLTMVLPNMLGEPILQGMAVRKDEQALAEAWQAGLNQLIEDGTYTTILEKYGVPDIAVSKSTINGGTVSSGG